MLSEPPEDFIRHTGEPDMAMISGTVRDNFMVPLPDATVGAYDQQNVLVSEDKTGSGGENLGIYRLTRVEQGQTYLLRVTVDEATRTVGEVNVNSKNVTRDISLSEGSTTM